MLSRILFCFLTTNVLGNTQDIALCRTPVTDLNVHDHSNIHDEIPDNVRENSFDIRLNETPPTPKNI